MLCDTCKEQLDKVANAEITVLTVLTRTEQRQDTVAERFHTRTPSSLCNGLNTR